MRGRWELSDARWRTIEPILRRSDAPTGEGVRGKIREPCSTGFYGYWALAHSGANCLGNIRLPDLPPPPSAVGTRAQAGADLAGPSQGVRGPRETSTGGGFYRRLLTGQKSGLAIGPTKRAKGRKSSLSPSMAVFLSPLVSKALRPTKASLLKASSGTAS